MSAVLMTATIRNEFVLDFATSSNTDWAVTMPTARFYTDGPVPTAPFDAAFAASGYQLPLLLEAVVSSDAFRFAAPGEGP